MKQLLIISCFVFVACKKDAKSIDTSANPTPPTQITAGSPSSQITVHDVKDTTLYKWDLAGTNETSFYYIDLNSDGTNDFMLSNANGHPFGGTGLIETNYITSLNSLSSIVCDSIYQTNTVSNGTQIVQLSDNLFPKEIAISGAIAISNRWRQGKFLISTSGNWSGTHYETSCWMSNTPNYIGVRCNNQLGWIKCSANGAVTIYEFACVNVQ